MHFSCICTWYKSFDIPMPAYWYYCWFIYIYNYIQIHQFVNKPTSISIHLSDTCLYILSPSMSNNLSIYIYYISLYICVCVSFCLPSMPVLLIAGWGHAFSTYSYWPEEGHSSWSSPPPVWCATTSGLNSWPSRQKHLGVVSHWKWEALGCRYIIIKLYLNIYIYIAH